MAERTIEMQRRDIQELERWISENSSGDGAEAAQP